jgi:hypothetical protein
VGLVAFVRGAVRCIVELLDWLAASLGEAVIWEASGLVSMPVQEVCRHCSVGVRALAPVAPTINSGRHRSSMHHELWPAFVHGPVCFSEVLC